MGMYHFGSTMIEKVVLLLFFAFITSKFVLYKNNFSEKIMIISFVHKKLIKQIRSFRLFH